ELTFRVSMSYGPGRYDPDYEERGQDYPYAHVRWTEGRNLEAFVDLLAARRIDVEPLITHRFEADDGERAYQLITGEMNKPHLGVILQYDSARAVEARIPVATREPPAAPAKSVRVGLIGAGTYARAMLLPHFKAAGAEFCSV